VKLTHYAGCFRGFLGAGEAICFGVDSIGVPFAKEAGVIFAFYLAGIVSFYYLGWYHIEETLYFKEDDAGVVIPNHILEARAALNEAHVPTEKDDGTTIAMEPARLDEGIPEVKE